MESLLVCINYFYTDIFILNKFFISLLKNWKTTPIYEDEKTGAKLCEEGKNEEAVKSNYLKIESKVITFVITIKNNCYNCYQLLFIY